ncbi:MAG: putative capsid protein [Circoviridae sp.]|nr:MAG: putative capsid protein [Circoviridae sp.]
MYSKAKAKPKGKAGAWRKRRKTTDLVRVPRGKIGFPQSMRTTLRMVHTKVFEPSGTQALSETIQANGLYQPLVSTAKKPRGFDQFMTIYGNYTVLSCKAHVRFMYEGYDGPSAVVGSGDELIKTFNIATESGDARACIPVACGVRKGTGILGTASNEDVLERERVKSVFITSQQGSRSVTVTASAAEFYKNYSMVSNEGYTGNSTANPSVPVFLEAWCARPVNYEDSESKVIAFIELEFDTIFTNPLPLLQTSPPGGGDGGF